MKGTILVVDDDRALCELVQTGLQGAGFAVHIATSAADAIAMLDRVDPDVVVADLNMREVSGLELCARIVESRPDVPVVLITAFGSLETAVGAIRAGAYDFLTKPFEMDALVLAIERALQHRRLRSEVQRLRRVVEDARGLGDLVGASPAMRGLYDLVERAAPSSASVLITGESGTGKELVARALHRRSRRSAGLFVAVNCAAIPESLLESELFGHVRGAFTDARGARSGLFLQAHGGTLFLDEIGDLPVSLQPKLLRALQERAIRPVGSDAEVPCDVRVVAATNHDLEAAVREGRFREDLFFRLAVIQLPVPPLRERGNDVLVLAQHFLERAAADAERPVRALSPGAAERLLAYDWPGNVRELQNAIERAVALARTETLSVDDLPERVTGPRTRVAGVEPTPVTGSFSPLEEVERRHILRVLEAMGGNKTLSAQVLGIDRKTLHRKLVGYGASVRRTQFRGVASHAG
jgi:two-component system, NtrC family, response regulator AtoC